MLNSRNLLRITDRDHRRRYLKAGRLQVVSLLSDLPKTTHDLMGFAVDLVIFNVSILKFLISCCDEKLGFPEKDKLALY